MSLWQSPVWKSSKLFQVEVNLSRKLYSKKTGEGWINRWEEERKERKVLRKEEKKTPQKIIFTSMLYDFHSSHPQREFKQIGNNFKDNVVKIRCDSFLWWLQLIFDYSTCLLSWSFISFSDALSYRTYLEHNIFNELTNVWKKEAC